MATLIDQLTVELGLDSAKYKKGTEEVTRRQKNVQDLFKKSGESMTKSIVDVARNIFVAFVGFETVSGLMNFLGRLNQAQASLSRISQNLGISARALDVWDKKIELAGGSVQGAQTAIQGLMSDVNALLTRNEVSPLIRLFGFLGVSTAGAAYDANKAKEAYENLFAALAKKPRSVAFQLATQAGISPDVLAYGLSSPADRARISAEAERLSHATDANTKEADRLRERWVAIKDAVEDIGIELLSKITPAIERMLPTVEKLALAFANWLGGMNADSVTGSMNKLGAAIDSLSYKLQTLADYWNATWKTFNDIGEDLSDPLSVITHPLNPNENPNADILTPHGWGKVWQGIKDWFGDFGNFSSGPYADTFRAATIKYHLPPGFLESIAQRESNFNPNAVSPKGAVGIMQLLPKYHPNAGKDPNEDIMEAAETLAALYDQFHNWATVAAAYNAGSDRIGRAISGQATVPRETRDYVAGVGQNLDYLRSGGRFPAGSAQVTNHNNTTVGPITINTQATDGKQVGIDFMAEMRKRDLVIQSDSGIIP